MAKVQIKSEKLTPFGMAETVAPFTIARRCNDFLECPSGTARSTAFARAKSFQRIAQKILVSNHS